MEQASETPLQTGFSVWKAVKIGTHKSVQDLSRLLIDRGFTIIDDGVIEKTPLAEAEETIDLVLISGRDLGFEKKTRREIIYGRAQEYGLELAPAEVGIQLRLQYPEQPGPDQQGSDIAIGMEPLLGTDGGLSLYIVLNDAEDGLSLVSVSCADDNDEWSPDILWVFARRAA